MDPNDRVNKGFQCMSVKWKFFLTPMRSENAKRKFILISRNLNHLNFETGLTFAFIP